MLKEGVIPPVFIGMRIASSLCTKKWYRSTVLRFFPQDKFSNGAWLLFHAPYGRFYWLSCWSEVLQYVVHKFWVLPTCHAGQVSPSNGVLNVRRVFADAIRLKERPSNGSTCAGYDDSRIQFQNLPYLHRWYHHLFEKGERTSQWCRVGDWCVARFKCFTQLKLMLLFQGRFSVSWAHH